MNFSQFQEHDRRLVLLKGLEHAVGYRANAYLLRRYADAVGHVVGADRINADLDWLSDAGLVKLERTGDVVVATLTERGLDVATGRTRVTGVQPPQPGA